MADKEPWEMAPNEFRSAQARDELPKSINVLPPGARNHEDIVNWAIKNGKKVPSEVLEAHSDIAFKHGVKPDNLPWNREWIKQAELNKREVPKEAYASVAEQIANAGGGGSNWKSESPELTRLTQAIYAMRKSKPKPTQEAEKKEPASSTAKQLADAEKNHNRLKKLGTTEATKEFGSYPKYIEALKETRLKLNDAKADHEDSASGDKGTEKKPEPEKVEEKPKPAPLTPKPVDKLFERLLKLKGVIVHSNGMFQIPEKLFTTRRRTPLTPKDRADQSLRYRTSTMGEVMGDFNHANSHDTLIFDQSVRGARAVKPVEVAKEIAAPMPEKKVEEKPASKTSKAKEPNKDKGWEQIKKDIEKLHAKMRNADPADYEVLTKEEIQKAHQDDIKDIMSTKEKRIKEAEENYEKLKKLGSVKFDTYAEYTKALNNSREEVDEAKSDHGSMAKLVARAKRDWNDNPFDSKADHEDSASDEAKEPEAKKGKVKEPEKKPEPEKVEEKPVEQMTPEQSAAKEKLRRTDGWKLHLNVSEDANDPLTQAISKNLTALGVKHKVGRSSGQAGKGMTIYVGSKDAARAIAARLEKEHTLPAGINLPEDVRWSQGVNARFDISSRNSDFHQYGVGGTPVFHEDVKNVWPPNLGFTAANASKADRALVKLYGSFYTGSSAAEPAPEVEPATPPKATPAAETGAKEKPASAQTTYDEAKSRLDAIGNGPLKPRSEKKWFGSGGREGANPSAVAQYDADVKAYNSYRAKYSKLKTAEVDASNKLFHEEQAVKKPEDKVEEKPKPATPPKEPVAEVKEMKEKPKQQNLDFTDPPKAKEEKPVEAKKEDAPKEKAKGDITPEQDEKIRSEHKKLDKLMDRARASGRDPGDMKAVKEQKKVVDTLLVEANLDPLAKSQEGVLQNRVRPLPKYTVNGGASSLRQVGVNRAKEEREKKASDRMAKVEANIKEAQANRTKEDKEFAETSAANLKTGDGGTRTTNPVTGKGGDSPTDQKTGGGKPKEEKDPEPKKVLAPLTPDQSKPIYEASTSADNSLQALNNLPNGHPDREAFFQRYVDHRNILSKLLKAADRDPLLKTGKLKDLKQDHGLPKDLLQGAGEHRKAQEEEKASREAADQAKAEEMDDGREFSLGKNPDPDPNPAAGVPPKAPTQRIEPTFTKPRIESMVGSTSPLPQTQPQPQAKAPVSVFGIDDDYFGPDLGDYNFDREAKSRFDADLAADPIVPAPAAPTPQPQVQPAPAAPTPQPQVQPAPAGAAPVAPAPWFPLGQGNGQVTWPPQPAAGVAPPAPSGRGSQAANQAAAASGAKPVDQGQFAPSNPQPQQQPKTPAPWFPLGQGNDQAPWPPQNDQTIPAPVPQPQNQAPTPAPAPPGTKPQPAPTPTQPQQQQPQKPGTPQPKPPFNPFQRTEPAPTQPKPQPQQKPGTPQPKPPFNPFERIEPTPAQPKPKPPFNPFERIENKVAPRTSRPKQQPKTQPQPVPVPAAPAPVQQQPMSRLEKVKRALASVGQGIGAAAASASQSVQRVATHGVTKAALAHLGVAALHGINYPKAIKNLGEKVKTRWNPGWHGFTSPIEKPKRGEAPEQQEAPVEPKEAAEPKTSGKWERKDR